MNAMKGKWWFGIVLGMFALGVLVSGCEEEEEMMGSYIAEGVLDETFNETGYVTIDPYPGKTNHIREIVVQDDDKMVGGGDLAIVNGDPHLVRYNPDATPDTTFGPAQNGVATYVDPGSAGDNTFAFSLKEDNAGRLIQYGSAMMTVGATTANGFYAVRYSEDGLVDTSYGTNGVARFNLPLGMSNWKGDVDGLGRSVMVGYRGQIAVIVRFTATGQVDTQFNGGLGHHLFSIGFGQSFHGVTVDSQDRILAAGWIRAVVGGPQTGLLVRYTADGLPDPAFGGDYNADGTPDGYITVDPPLAGDPNSVFLASGEDDQGRILVAGSAKTPAGTWWIMVGRLLDDGSPDTSFGPNGSGWFVLENQSGASNQDSASEIILDAAGNILVSGWIQWKTNGLQSQDPIVLRLTPDGLLDSTFAGGSGFFTLDGMGGLAAGTEFGQSIKMDSFGRIVGGGLSHYNANPNSFFFRLR